MASCSSNTYSISTKPDAPGKFIVAGGTKPYVVTLIANWNGARCSCPQGIFRARKTGVPCKHEAFVRASLANVAL